MPNYTSDGFTQDGGSTNGMVFGNPDDSSDGSPMDYMTWDWKQIQAAIVGLASGSPNDSDWAHARAVADPRSLQVASGLFHDIQTLLEGVSKALSDQANALAGDNGPWKGDASQSFHNMMTNFSRQVQANADVLSGGSTGINSVPKQLQVNAIQLNNAQVIINNLNIKYAALALKAGAKQGPDGAVSISAKPEILNAMTNEMRQVLINLAHAYRFTTDSIINPTTLDVTVNSGDVSSPSGGDGLDGGLGADPGAGGDIPGLGDDAGLGGGDLGADPQSLAALAGSPDTGIDSGIDGLDTGGGIGGGLDNLAADPGLGVNPYNLAADPGLGVDPSDLGGGTDGLGLGDGADIGGSGIDPSALDNLLNPAAYSGLSGLGAGSGSALGDEALGGLAAEDPSAFGNTGLDDGLAGGIGDNLGETLGDGLGAAEGASQLANSSGYPYMPGMGGGAGANALTSEPSDASGLLDPSTEPWEGDTALGDDEVGSELGAAAGGEGLGTAAAEGGLAAAGMPYLPGMGGAPGSRDAAGERSDASGLLEPSTEPWEPEETAEAEDVGSPDGVLPGVPYLLGFGAPVSAARPATNQGPVEGGEPAEATAAEPAAAARGDEAEATASGAPVMLGSDGVPLPADDSNTVVQRPLPADGEEDFSAWEAAADAGAFVPLLWAVPRQGQTQSGTDEGEDGLAHEPRSTWQPERPTGETSPDASAVTPFVSLDDEPETDAEEEEALEEEATEEASRGIADLLVQEESTWGTVPGGSNSLF
ncbi:WXG100 family type VII secretion target [Streptomyces sp. NBC_00728]|uniref:WXG100 family type VII secretion target n=1 Tax=Streptomyces sp. NBC_00728 TaxID=2903676 RepID=UPI003866C99A